LTELMQQEPAELSRRERRKLEVRNRILAAAITLFDRQGVAATTLAEISERADVAQKTFFNHFASRQQLISELAQEGLQTLIENLEDVRKQPLSTRERLLAFFEKIADNAESAGAMRRELLTEMIHVAHETGDEPEQTRKMHEGFGAIVHEGLAAGDVTRAHDPETLTVMMLGAFYALMFDWANLENYPLRERALAAARFLGDAMAARQEE